MTKHFDELLNMDPLLEAENVTGKSYKEDEDTLMLGMALHMMKNDQVRTELGLRGDTYYGMPYDEYVAVAHNLGFKTLLTLPFTNKEGIEETQEFLWRDGLLLITESFTWERGGKKSTNNARIFFNCEFADSSDAWGFRFSGHLHSDMYDQGRYIWVGDVDAREALVNTVNRMETECTILKDWVEKPFMYLSNYMDEKTVHEMPTYEWRVNRDKMLKDIMEQFPKDVQEYMDAPDGL